MSVKTFLLTATAALSLGEPGALGASLSVDGGALGTVSKGNDLLEPLGFGPSLVGYLGATVSGSAKAYKYEFLGFEAGARNLFVIGSPALSFSTEDFTSNREVGEPLEAITTDFLEFAFLTSLSSKVASGKESFEGRGFPNAFVSFGDGRKTGNVLYAFFDDAGAGNDSDHDDMVVRITALTAIPVPAPLGLLLGSLVGLGLLSRRSTKPDAGFRKQPTPDRTYDSLNEPRNKTRQS